MTESGRNVGRTIIIKLVQARCRLALHSALITSLVMRVYRRRYVYFILYNASPSLASRKLPVSQYPLIYETCQRLFSWLARVPSPPRSARFYILSRRAVSNEENIEDNGIYTRGRGEWQLLFQQAGRFVHAWKFSSGEKKFLINRSYLLDLATKNCCK